MDNLKEQGNVSIAIEKGYLEPIHYLYTGVNNIVENLTGWHLLKPVWDLCIQYQYYTKSPLFPIVLSVGFYLVAASLLMAVEFLEERLPWLHSHKIQPNVRISWTQQWKAMSGTLWNQVVIILPISLAQWTWTPSSVLPSHAPGIFEFSWQIAACVYIMDTEYFFWHLIHHKVRYLYKKVHSIHHQFHSPFSWTTQYLHPWELLSVGFFVTTSPWVVRAHPLTTWGFMIWSIIISIEAHLGFDLPWQPHRWLPAWVGWGGSIKHDMHHQRPLTNISPFFNHWDILCGTYCPHQLAGGVKSKELFEYERKEAAEMAKEKDD